MATLNVTNLQNTAATVTNVSLLADGTTTLVLNATGTSRLGGLRYNAGNLEVYTAGAVWASIGGGSTYTATAPIKVTGTVISVDLGLGVAANGANLALKVPVAATPPAIGTGAAQAFDGSMYWDDTLGQLFIRYINGGSSAWVAAAPPAGGVPAASLAEAAAGVTTVKYSSPATAVPKDAANMTGAAILPAGTVVQRPATPAEGMLRVNTDSNPDSVEAYDAAATRWRKLAYVPEITSTVDLIPANGSVLPAGGTYRSITINTGVTVTVPGICILTAKNITINGTVNGAGLGSSPGGTVSGTAFQGGQRGFGLASATGLSYGFQSFFGTGGGSGGFVVSGGSASGGSGGSAGAALVLKVSESITVGATGSIDCSGGNGVAGFAGGVSSICGGGGGGSGGLVLLQSEGNITLTAGAILNVDGGDGSAATGVGVQTGGGGGGGGGGWIVLNAFGTLSNAATTSLLGGAGGTSRGVPPYTIDSGIGGAWAGDGGLPASPVSNSGIAGQLITGAFI